MIHTRLQLRDKRRDLLPHSSFIPPCSRQMTAGLHYIHPAIEARRVLAGNVAMIIDEADAPSSPLLQPGRVGRRCGEVADANFTSSVSVCV